jgi:hypothetical protein
MHGSRPFSRPVVPPSGVNDRSRPARRWDAPGPGNPSGGIVKSRVLDRPPHASLRANQRRRRSSRAGSILSGRDRQAIPPTVPPLTIQLSVAVLPTLSQSRRPGNGRAAPRAASLQARDVAWACAECRTFRAASLTRPSVARAQAPPCRAPQPASAGRRSSRVRPRSRARRAPAPHRPGARRAARTPQPQQSCARSRPRHAAPPPPRPAPGATGSTPGPHIGTRPAPPSTDSAQRSRSHGQRTRAMWVRQSRPRHPRPCHPEDSRLPPDGPTASCPSLIVHRSFRHRCPRVHALLPRGRHSRLAANGCSLRAALVHVATPRSPPPVWPVTRIPLATSPGDDEIRIGDIARAHALSMAPHRPSRTPIPPHQAQRPATRDPTRPHSLPHLTPVSRTPISHPHLLARTRPP